MTTPNLRDNRLWGGTSSKTSAERVLLRTFADVQRRVNRDAKLTCVDISPVFEFYNASTGESLNALYRQTPVSLPFPSAVFGGMFPAADVVPDATADAQCVIFIECQRWADRPNLLSCREIPWGKSVEPSGFFIQMNEDGTLHENLDGKYPGTGLLRGVRLSSPHLIEVVLCALAMFHVRNIGTREVNLPRSLRRRMTRDGYEGPQVYRTLTLRPLSGDNEAGRPKMQTGERPLHLVRGHFARYKEEKPLFGRYVGTFWRPEHEAGNASVAVVRKTYKFDLTARGDSAQPDNI